MFNQTCGKVFKIISVEFCIKQIVQNFILTRLPPKEIPIRHSIAPIR